MTELVTILCPHCSFSKTVPRDMIPENAAKATCPSCRQPFALNRETLFQSAPLSVSLDGDEAEQIQPPPLESHQADTASGKAAPPLEPVDTSLQLLNFSFKGTAVEYFGIWIVNTLLKIVTAGIYSAWAKVRMRRFFYGSTSLQGHSFEYLADPLTLFKGWLIAACAFILYMVASRINPLLSLAVGLVIFAVFPWLLVRSRIFNMRNSSYRNIRFGFKADYAQAYLVYAGLPLLSVLSLGILFPYMLYRQKKFMVENSSFGSTLFTFTARIKDFYILCLKIGLGFLALIIILGGFAVMLAGGLSAFSSGAGRIAALGGLAFLPMLAFPLIYFLFMVYAMTALSNLCWNGTRLGGNTFVSKMRTARMTLLFITNAVAIIFSLGLMMPWATVRMTRYRFETLAVLSDNSIDGIMAAAANRESISAAGEEIGDVFDMSIDIGL